MITIIFSLCQIRLMITLAKFEIYKFILVVRFDKTVNTQMGLSLSSKYSFIIIYPSCFIFLHTYGFSNNNPKNHPSATPTSHKYNREGKNIRGIYTSSITQDYANIRGLPKKCNLIWLIYYL